MQVPVCKLEKKKFDFRTSLSFYPAPIVWCEDCCAWLKRRGFDYLLPFNSDYVKLATKLNEMSKEEPDLGLFFFLPGSLYPLWLIFFFWSASNCFINHQKTCTSMRYKHTVPTSQASWQGTKSQHYVGKEESQSLNMHKLKHTARITRQPQQLHRQCKRGIPPWIKRNQPH